MSDFPCKCGHSSKDHAKEFLSHPLSGNSNWEHNSCFVMCEDPPLPYCRCMKFVLDNLTLVEKLARERNLV